VKSYSCFLTKQIVYSKWLLCLDVLHVLVLFYVFVLFGLFCHSGHKLDMSTLFTTFCKHLFNLYYVIMLVCRWWILVSMKPVCIFSYSTFFLWLAHVFMYKRYIGKTCLILSTCYALVNHNTVILKSVKLPFMLRENKSISL